MAARARGAEIICRDRASICSLAGREAAPDATVVADRWRLRRNLSRAVGKICHQHRACLRVHAEQAPPDAPRTSPLDVLPKTLILDRVQQRYEQVNRMLDAGCPLSGIARRLGLDRKTVPRYRYRDTGLDALIASARDRRDCPLDRYRPFLQARFAVGDTGATALYRQRRERGYRGGYSTLTRCVLTLRENTVVPAPADIPSRRTVTSWIMRPRENLSAKDAGQLDRVRLACPDIIHVCNVARAFADVVRRRRVTVRPRWIGQARPGPATWHPWGRWPASCARTSTP